MKNWILGIMIIGLLLLRATSGYATTHTNKHDYQKNQSEFESIQKSASDMILLKGEIIGITDKEILVNPFIDANEIAHLKLIQGTKIYCNGNVSQWEALTPVAPGAYFEAQVIVNAKNEVIAVNAFYYGEECVIKKCYQNQGKLILELNSVPSKRYFTYPVNQDARLPSEEYWRQEGQVVYILFNGVEEIRAVFLPD